MKIIKEPKGIVFTVTGQGLDNLERLKLSEIIRQEKARNKNHDLVLV